MFSNLLQKSATYIPKSFKSNIVDIEDINFYLNNHKHIVDELQIIDSKTNKKISYSYLNTMWRTEYDSDNLENLWNSGNTFIIHTPFISKSTKEIVKNIEDNNPVSCDAHTYFGKESSKSFQPHSDSSFNLIIQCVGETLWTVWDYIDEHSRVFPNLPYDKNQILFQVLMKPGDAIILPKGQVHEARSITDRISVSFPFVPGKKTIQKDINLKLNTNGSTNTELINFSSHVEFNYS